MQDGQHGNTDNSTRSLQDGSPDPTDEPAQKRMKRGKYVPKACGQCQRRKIKCDGNVPCQQCARRGRDCQMMSLDMRRRPTTINQSKSYATVPDMSGCHIGEEPTTRELATRLDRIEHQLSLLLSSLSNGRGGKDNVEGDYVATSQEEIQPDVTSPPQARVPTFSGEASMVHSMEQVEGRLADMGVEYKRRDSATTSQTPSPTLSPSPGPKQDNTPERQKKIDIRSILNAYGIESDRACWDGFLQTFCDEVHILYPILHLPSLWSSYEKMWEQIHHPSSQNELKNGEFRFEVTQVLICLALGRCTQSPRVDSENARHSAGWSLYDAAMAVLGDLLGSFQQCSSPLLVLQNFLLIVVYLFRLDANDKAEKYLALTISHAHHLGLHRRKVVQALPFFNCQMFQQLWWCLYVIDRRLSIETGRPFLIQDVNVDVPLPQEVSDDWLTRYRDDSRKSVELTAEIEAEATQDTLSMVPYLTAMVSYSRVVGKAWEIMYGASVTESTPSPALCDYLEQLLSQAQTEVRQEYVHNHFQPASRQLNSSPWWQVKQRMLMHFRWFSLRLMIRKPILQRAAAHHGPIQDSLENEMTCIGIANSIIEEFNQIPEEYSLTNYPFFHYLINAVITSLGLLIKEPSFRTRYGSVTFEATRSLKAFCRKTWVSGRMVRTVSRLNKMAKHVLEDNNALPGGLSASQQLSPASGTGGPLHISSLTSRSPVDVQPQSSVINPFNKANLPFLHAASPQDAWTAGSTNLVMTDFDFEETTADMGSARYPFGKETYTLAPPQQRLTASDAQSGRLPLQPTRELQQAEIPGQDVGDQADWLQVLFGEIGSHY